MGLVRIGEISHLWERAHILRDYKQGKIDKKDICDADFLLKTAARFHGHQSQRLSGKCPICAGEDLKEVWWVHGEELGRASGSARDYDEIIAFAKEGKEFEVHTVEVCPDCGWNHLLVQQRVHWNDD